MKDRGRKKKINRNVEKIKRELKERTNETEY